MECVGDCSERVRGGVMETAVKELGGSVCETETAMKELGGGVYDGDCSERVRGGVCWRLQ